MQQQRPLPRRLRLGVELGPELDVLRVIAGGMAEAADMIAGDVLLSLDAHPVSSRHALQVALRSPNNDRVRIGFRRAGEVIAKSVTAIRAPCEEDVIYDAVECADGARLRTLINVPSGVTTQTPVIVFIQGLSLATMETAYTDLFRGFRDEGVVTMRIEKRGVGDSEGDAPERVDFATEVADVRAAIASTARYDAIDPNAVFVFGHSVGGMIAPLLDLTAAAEPQRLRGIITYGSSAEPWFDCLEASGARQWAMNGATAEEVETRMQALRDELENDDAVIDGRSAALYHRPLHEADIAAAFARVGETTTRVLVLQGAYDWVISEAEAQRIADLSHGSLRLVPHLDHLMTAHHSLDASMKAYGTGHSVHTDLIRETCRFMREEVM